MLFLMAEVLLAMEVVSSSPLPVVRGSAAAEEDAPLFSTVNSAAARVRARASKVSLSHVRRSTLTFLLMEEDILLSISLYLNWLLCYYWICVLAQGSAYVLFARCN